MKGKKKRKRNRNKPSDFECVLTQVLYALAYIEVMREFAKLRRKKEGKKRKKGNLAKKGGVANGRK
jgi:hypothetical protein